MGKKSKGRKPTMYQLKRQLRLELNTAVGKRIEDELNRRFRYLYKLRAK